MFSGLFIFLTLQIFPLYVIFLILSLWVFQCVCEHVCLSILYVFVLFLWLFFPVSLLSWFVYFHFILFLDAWFFFSNKKEKERLGGKMGEIWEELEKREL